MQALCLLLHRSDMPRQYLNVPYRSKDQAKALGARFDGSVKQWYVESGVDLAPFATWLPAGGPQLPSTTDVALPPSPTTELATAKKGISLSRLLNGVSAAVAQAFAGGVWTLVEVTEAATRNGHVYLDLSERDGSGQLVAKARATIWANTAARILPEFERATGAVIGAGIKLLVRARPVFKSQYGFSLDIDAIDAEYTLGDLEARKKEIRARLQREGIFDLNRKLPSPWDYRVVLVIAPQEAAGLGDFRKESERLSQFGLCHFHYVHSRFQGEGAPRDIVAAAAAALAALEEQGGPGYPDAVVLIRGGGAVNDLAWLNDYELARFICEQTIPVLTGIGHERDSTIPDQVANQRFDTPSKVIAAIEQQIRLRAREAQGAWEAVVSTGARLVHSTRLEIQRMDSEVRSAGRDHLARARLDSGAAVNTVAVNAVHNVHGAARTSLELLNQVRAGAAHDLALAKQQVPALLTSIQMKAQWSVGEGRKEADVAFHAIVHRASATTRSADQLVDSNLRQVAERGDGKVQQARQGSQALMREITGQGPDKTLSRGFAIVRTESGSPVTTSSQASSAPSLTIQFKDGTVPVQPEPSSRKNS